MQKSGVLRFFFDLCVNFKCLHFICFCSCTVVRYSTEPKAVDDVIYNSDQNVDIFVTVAIQTKSRTVSNQYLTRPNECDCN